MDILQTIILGLVQGVSEFLPISSSGHLVLTPWFFGWEDPGLSFDVALHLGTLIAVVTYFRKDIFQIGKSFFENKNLGRGVNNETKKIKKKSALTSKYRADFLWLVVVATIPGALSGYFFEDYAETVFRSPLVIAFMLAGVGFLIFWADRKKEHQKEISEINLKMAIFIGIAQALAIIPGTSRSGITIVAALLLGLKRVDAAKFSFLMSIPIIFGATVFKFKDFIDSGIGSPELLGILIAGISGFLAIAGLIKFVERVSYQLFFWYRLVLAIIIVLVYFS